MFTGLIEDVGSVEGVEPLGGKLRLLVRAPLLQEEMPLGASLAVDGVCLTLTAWSAGLATMEVGPETLERTTLGEFSVGTRVNLERPLKLGDRLGGHLVAGHVDGTGHISALTSRGNAIDVTIVTPPALLRYVVAKGSIAIDGISLTVNRVDASGFSVSIIPHTQDQTTLTRKREGEKVNLEVDLIGKYVEKLVAPHTHTEPKP